MTAVQAGGLRSIRHDVRLTDTGANLGREVAHEEITMEFDASWRGEPVIVRMTASRYRHSSGMSEWRGFCEDARFGKPGDALVWGNKVTDTARQRLGEAHAPMVPAYLGSPEYKQSYRRALTWALRGLLTDEAHRGADASRARAGIEAFRDEIIGAELAALLDACDALDAFTAAIAAVDSVWADATQRSTPLVK